MSDASQHRYMRVSFGAPLINPNLSGSANMNPPKYEDGYAFQSSLQFPLISEINYR